MNYVSEHSAVGQHQSAALLRVAGREFDLTQTLRTFWRRKNLFAGIVTMLMAIAVLGVYALAPLYTAQTDLIIENREQKVAELKAVLGDVMPDKEGLLSELEVIRSRTIAEKVIQQLRLDADPEFNAALKPAGVLARTITEAVLQAQTVLPRYLPTEVSAFLFDRDSRHLSDDERRAREYERVVDKVLERLTVGVKGQSRAIVISFTSESPDKAARIANAVATHTSWRNWTRSSKRRAGPTSGSRESCKTCASRSRNPIVPSRSTDGALAFFKARTEHSSRSR